MKQNRNSLYFFLIKAATGMAVFCCLSIYANEAKVLKVEEQIQKAQNLLIAGKRKQALSLLQESRRKIKNSKQLIHFDIEAKKIATFFVSEEGQKLFELGRSMGESSPNLAIEKFQQALSIEDGNLQVLSAIVLLQLKIDQCQNAKNWVDQANEIYRYNSLIQTLNLQTLDCLGSFEQITEALKAIKQDKIDINSQFLQLIQAKQEIQNGSIDQGRKALQKISKRQPAYPEIWYWRWKLDPKQGQIQLEYLQKYITICKNLTPRLKRTYETKEAVCYHFNKANRAFEEQGASAIDSGSQ